MRFVVILIILNLVFIHSQTNLLQTPNAKNYSEKLAEYPFRFSPTSAKTIISTLKKTVPLKISAIEKPLLKDALDGKFESFSIAEAALIASGVTQKNLRQQYLKKMKSIYRGVQNFIPQGSTDKQVASYLLLYLHKYHFKSYDIKSSSLTELLDRGVYNCVSSSLLYNILARRLGLNVRGVEAPEHCFSQ